MLIRNTIVALAGNVENMASSHKHHGTLKTVKLL